MRRAAERILIVEDDEDARAFVERALERSGYTVATAGTAVEARGILDDNGVDLVVLDLGLPDESGLDFLTALRDDHDVGIVVLTGRDSIGDRVLGLDTGADDYLVKPVQVPELQARVRAVLRRTRSQTPRLSYGPLVIDLNAREAHLGGEPVDLTRKEFDLLVHLAAHPRSVFDRAELLRDVWDSSAEYQDPATVTEHVRRLRRKLGDDPDDPRWIVAIRGVGYRFEPEGS